MGLFEGMTRQSYCVEGKREGSQQQRERGEERRRKTEGAKLKTYQNRKERCLILRAVDGRCLRKNLSLLSSLSSRGHWATLSFRSYTHPATCCLCFY